MSFDNILIHLTMLGDVDRTAGFQRALAEVVKPGDRVLDFGCGTGVLSVFAERAGAEVVYAVDRSTMIHAARRIAAANGCKRIQFLAGEGPEITLPGPVDVIVSEWMGHFLFDDGMMPALLRMRDRHLAPGGRMLPAAFSLHVALVTAPEHHARLTFLRNAPYGVDFGPVSSWPSHEAHRLKLRGDELLPGPACVGTLEMSRVSAMPERLSGTIAVDRATTSYGLCGWFDAQLSPGVTLGTGPDFPATHWQHLYFPFEQPLELRAGDRVEIELRPTELREQVAWTWTATGPRETRRSDSLVQQAWLADNARSAPRR